VNVFQRSSAKLLFAAASVFFLPLTACLHAPNPDTRVADEQTIRDLDAQWSKDAGAHNLSATVSYYADDALLLGPDEPVSKGKPAIRDSWAAALETFSQLSWEVKTIEVARSGDLAYLTGAWKGKIKGAKGSSLPTSGKLLEVWKKQPDGTWKCVADIYNSDAPMTPAPAGKK
jgi:uncharacterized protein (TIGR02246 family)